MIQKNECSIQETLLRPEFISKLKRIKKQKGIRFKSVEELRNNLSK